jgi:ribonuclease HII
MPDYSLETEHGGRVAGVDEAGRGPLAGPVVAAAVVFPGGLTPTLAALLDDSKKLTAEARLAAFAALHASGLAEIAVGAASVAEISRINILQATLLAMHRAVSRLATPPDIALVDGNQPPRLACRVRCVIGGDAASLSIAAASIVAKVIRDRAMLRLGLRHRAAPGGDRIAWAVPPPSPDLRRRPPAFRRTDNAGRLTRLPAFRQIGRLRQGDMRGSRPRATVGPGADGRLRDHDGHAAACLGPLHLRGPTL